MPLGGIGLGVTHGVGREVHHQVTHLARAELKPIPTSAGQSDRKLESGRNLA
jgi:hypothetical protein